jgi:thioredoxin reductase
MPPVSASKRPTSAAYDVVIVGAGPAGLSAALILGRACRRVLVCDRGTPRSWASHAMHGYLGHDGIDPGEFRRVTRAELARYPEVRLRRAEVTRARREGAAFVVEVAGRPVRARKLLLATGLMDELPPLPDVATLYGHSVFVCPYCDGRELRDPLRGRPAAAAARAVLRPAGARAIGARPGARLRADARRRDPLRPL